MPEKNVTEAMAPMDSTPIDPTIQAHLDSLSGGDLDRLADTYHPEAILILNKPLARISQARAVATGQANIKSVLQRQVDAGTDNLELRDYVQGKDTVVARFALTIRGRAHDAFAYYLLRDGKISRYVAGIYGGPKGLGHASPATIHPVFKEQVDLLARGDLDGLTKTYDPKAIWVLSASNSWAARARGAVEGQQHIREHLGSYVKLNAQLVELQEYTETGDTLFVQAIMQHGGVAEHASGAYVFAGNKILRQASSCGPRAA